MTRLSDGGPITPGRHEDHGGVFAALQGVPRSHPGLVPVHDSATDPMHSEPYVIKQVHQETADVFTFDLVPAAHAPNFTFAPGQFNMIYMFGMGEVAISISSDSTVYGRLIHTIRAVGPITRAICKLKKGDMLGIRGPFGAGWPVQEARGHDVLFVTGGIGLPPLRPAIYYVLAHRQDYGKVTILYGARSPQRLLYRKELEQWRGRFDVTLDVAVGVAGRDWHGNVGVINSLLGQARLDPDNTVAMLCSSESMMHSLANGLIKLGMADDRIYLSMERNMKCAIGLCGHCQLGPYFICKDGPVFSYEAIKEWFVKREV